MTGSPYDPALSAAVAGDATAILALMSAAQPDIRRYALRACRTSSDAEDAVQEVLWMVYRHVGGLRNLGAFSGWLFRIVARTCLKLAKTVLRYEPFPDNDADLELSNRPDAELRLDLAKAIQSLPQHYRDVLLLRDAQEMTIAEIANLLQLTRESVKARLHRARGLVREYFAG